MVKRNITLGAFLIIMAALIILNSFGLRWDVSWIDIIIVVLLVPIIVRNIFKLDFFGAFMPLAVICILFDEQLGIEAITPWPVIVAAVLLSIGMTYIFPKYKKYKAPVNGVNNNTASDEKIWITERFGSSIKYINSQNLMQLNIKLSFAGAKIFLDNASLCGGTAEINIGLDFSGLELFVPRGWTVKNNVGLSLSGFKEGGVVTAKKTGETVTINGSASMSGITVCYI